jgi:hypothetical protein
MVVHASLGVYSIVALLLRSHPMVMRYGKWSASLTSVFAVMVAVVESNI